MVGWGLLRSRVGILAPLAGVGAHLHPLSSTEPLGLPLEHDINRSLVRAVRFGFRLAPLALVLTVELATALFAPDRHHGA